jgi:glycosyltransferase involved in cell wall biosynthesis
LVSVIVTNRDYGRYVEAAVDSALGQSYPRMEVVVVDDASSDDSLARLERYGDRIGVVSLPESVGQHGAVEAGLGVSSGELVCLLDADDCWHRNKVERVVERFARDSGLTQVSHGYRTIDAVGAPHTARRSGGPARRWLQRRIPLSEGDVTPLLLRYNRYGWGITSGLAYPRWVLEEALPLPLEFRSEGLDTWTTVAAAFLGHVGAVDADLMDYRLHQSNFLAGSVDVARHAGRRRLTGAMVSHWAQRTGRGGVVDVQRIDNELVLYRFLAGEAVSVRERVRAVVRSVAELFAVGSGPVHFTLELGRRGVLASSRRHGLAVERVGITAWVRRRGVVDGSRPDPATRTAV